MSDASGTGREDEKKRNEEVRSCVSARAFSHTGSTLLDPALHMHLFSTA